MSSSTEESTRLARVSSASLMDALGRRYRHRTHILDLVSPTPGRRLFGRALTIQCLPRRADAHDPVRHDIRALIERSLDGQDGSDRLAIISTSGCPGAVLGEASQLFVLLAMGLLGAVTDARVAGFQELAARAFSLWCAGESEAPPSGSELMPFCHDVPVVLAGVTVLPDDYIYADRGGAVVIPAAAVDWTLDEAASIEADDANYGALIAEEDDEDARDTLITGPPGSRAAEDA